MVAVIHHLGYDMAGATLHLLEDAPDILSKNSDGDQLDAAKEKIATESVVQPGISAPQISVSSAIHAP